MKADIRTLKLCMAKDKYEFIMSAIAKCKHICLLDGQNISDSRALELISAEFLSAYPVKIKED